jgi:phage terminase large subunit-like protein
MFLAGEAMIPTHNSRSGAEWSIEQAFTRPGSRGALVGETPGQVRSVMLEGDSGILTVSPPWFRPTYNPSKCLLTWPNGSVASTYSAFNFEELRGPQHHWGWADELAKWKHLGEGEAWDQLMLGMRLPPHANVCVTTTPRPIPLIKTLLKDSHTVVTRGTTYENLPNLADLFRQQVLAKYEGTRQGRQELNAEVLDDVEGALWTHARFEDLRAPKPGAWELRRVVVGVDPSGSSGEEGDAQGIIVAGLLKDGNEARVLDDLTCKLSPAGWGARVVEAVVNHSADCVVAERNFGGEMVEHVIQVAAREKNVAVRVKLVNASRGKVVRAEPIAGLYEQKRVRHCGMFSDLEDELCLFTPSGYQGPRSPNHADAAVWTISELMGSAAPASYSGLDKKKASWGRGR